MEKPPIFDWLREYHKTRNLDACLPHISSEGAVISPFTGRPYIEGEGENELYNGALIVSNGHTLVRDLIQDRIIEDDVIDGYHPIKDRDAFFSYLEKQKNNDGAFLYDSHEGGITRIYELGNKPQGLERINMLDFIPEDFVSFDGRVSIRSNLGTKTRLAIKLPQAYPSIETFQIKRSPYTNLRMGKITHFTRHGLAEEFFLMSVLGGDLTPREYADIMSVYRQYRRRGDKVTRYFETRDMLLQNAGRPRLPEKRYAVSP